MVNVAEVSTESRLVTQQAIVVETQESLVDAIHSVEQIYTFDPVTIAVSRSRICLFHLP